MRANHTHISFILDRSGSMYDLRREAIGGFNGFVESQRNVSGTADLSLVLFDHEYALVLENVDVQRVPLLDAVTYQPRGTTALLDAIGRTIDGLGSRLAGLPEERRPETVIIAILTDGLENASQSYTAERIAHMIRHQREKYGWDFVFLGANQDVITTAGSLSMDPTAAYAFESSAAGVAAAYSTLHKEVTRRRTAPKRV